MVAMAKRRDSPRAERFEFLAPERDQFIFVFHRIPAGLSAAKGEPNVTRIGFLHRFSAPRRMAPWRADHRLSLFPHHFDIRRWLLFLELFSLIGKPSTAPKASKGLLAAHNDP